MDIEKKTSWPWLELLLGLSVLALILQLIFADPWAGLWLILDPRNWRWSVWVGINIGVIFVLVYLRSRQE